MSGSDCQSLTLTLAGAATSTRLNADGWGCSELITDEIDVIATGTAINNNGALKQIIK